MNWDSANTALYAFPMHGQHKLLAEGYRTRDGHLIEWFGRKLAGSGNVAVISRPEPFFMPKRRMVEGLAPNTANFPSLSFRFPSFRDRRRWWVDSRHDYNLAAGSTKAPSIVWNPFVASSNVWSKLVSRRSPLVVDLLDDWTVHFAFQGIKQEVMQAYSRAFDSATHVTANSEATLALARRFGRNDAVLLTNGCDPERFDPRSRATGPLTVGYVGKIGRRLDLDLIVGTARALPNYQFILAGPILDFEYRRPLRNLKNVTLLGDVHYRDVPKLLTTFDVGWVPHRVGKGEVGGDVIKTYEYRAAGLPVLTTPVLGATSRGLDNVHALAAQQHVNWLRDAHKPGHRIAREIGRIPSESTWEFKARFLLDLLGLSR